jgi:hypothetical protein
MIYEDAFILAVTFFVLFLVGSVIIIICGDKRGKTSKQYPTYKPIKK